MLNGGRTEVAKTSNDVIRCTFKSEPYDVTTPSGRKLTLWDTAGLDEGSTGPATALAAIKNIRGLTLQLAASEGLSLIIYMMRGKLVSSIIKDYLLFKAFCDDKVPFVLVMTGLDGESDKAGWWHRNEKHFRQAGIRSDGHACIVATKYDHNEKAYAESARDVFELIERTSSRDPWKVDKNWFIQTVINVVAVLTASSKPAERTKVLYRGLIENDVEEDEAKAAVKVYQLNLKSVRAGSRK
ncbi:hypothetical protein FIBSPDRAFT_849039 [Athelia psychrophila]|uniref:P-loop containing nucleoside triphosphate hydrolase protein n=1 Tax=Athelia psychrophila TaxID=1759441 RepID=A0A166UUZ9_9AGAM|nr:hypothetical protein FIBSPDRAFT_849039 [Fibularhizoctonia sp. CBS 109695]